MSDIHEIITLDGPSGAGKSTIAKLTAKKLSFKYLDTGAMYRAVTLYMIKHDINTDSNDEVISALNNLNISFDNAGRIYLDNEDVTENFIKGADEVLKISKLYDVKLAVLKERSPSCGFGEIYDGTFNKVLINGNGICANLLANNNIKIIGECKIKEYFEL